MKTEEKLDLIVKLLGEAAQEFDMIAEQIKEHDLPLYRMLTEYGSQYLKQMQKGLHSSGQLETFKMRLKAANELLRLYDIEKSGLSDVSNHVCPIGKLDFETCFMKNNDGSCKGCPHLNEK